jgi:epoxyqueuosine reductase
MGDGTELTDLAIDYVMSQGACAAGITSRETLVGGPPSTDLQYLLPGARFPVTFAVPLDPDAIERYLSKKDHAGHQRDNIRTNAYVTGLGVGLATYVDQRGYPSFAVAANAVYRQDTPAGILDFKPDISHRYLAVRSGVGWFGFSGNVITKFHGAAVILGSVVTTAELEPTEPLPAD